jgi:sugar O-acyltransferase (sialic acid O-acetyltransferase NeuD family)
LSDTYLPVIVVGGGGHAKVLIDALLLLRRRVLGFTDLNEDRRAILGIPRLGDDDLIMGHCPEEVVLVNGIGSIASPVKRRAMFERLKAKGYLFEEVVHPSAVVSSDVVREEGIQIMAGAVVQTGCRLRANCIINTGAMVDHDCLVGRHAHVAPGAVISGGVTLSDGVHVGTGATLIQGVGVGEDSVIGAGAVILRDVPAMVTVVGVPGRTVKRAMPEGPGGVI